MASLKKRIVYVYRNPLERQLAVFEIFFVCSASSEMRHISRSEVPFTSYDITNSPFS